MKPDKLEQEIEALDRLVLFVMVPFLLVSGVISALRGPVAVVLFAVVSLAAFAWVGAFHARRWRHQSARWRDLCDQSLDVARQADAALERLQGAFERMQKEPWQ